MNKYKFYIVVIENKQSFNNLLFRKKIKENKGILAWWNYLSSTYILKVSNNISASNITELLRSFEFISNNPFFVVEIVIGNYSGFLPSDAWEWIKKQNTKPNNNFLL